MTRAMATVLAACALSACATSGFKDVKATGEELRYDGSYWQGSQQIDEQDFYKIAGDDEASDYVGVLREYGAMMQPVGLGIGTLGAGVGVGGLGLIYVLSQGEDDAASSGDGTTGTLILYAGYGVMAAGVLTLLGGGYAYYDGRDAVENQTWEPNRAEAAANSYNLALKKASGKKDDKPQAAPGGPPPGTLKPKR